MKTITNVKLNFATIGKDGKDDSLLSVAPTNTADVESLPVLNFATIGKDGKDDSLTLETSTIGPIQLESSPAALVF